MYENMLLGRMYYYPHRSCMRVEAGARSNVRTSLLLYAPSQKSVLVPEL